MGASISTAGFAVPLALFFLLTCLGLATLSLSAAGVALSASLAVERRLRFDLLHERALGEARAALGAPLLGEAGRGPGDLSGSLLLHRLAEPGLGEVEVRGRALAVDMVLLRTATAGEGGGAERSFGALLWVNDPDALQARGIPLIATAGGIAPGAGSGAGGEPAPRECRPAPGRPGTGPLPPRWTRPWDLALGWRGEGALRGQLVDRFRARAAGGLDVLDALDAPAIGFAVDSLPPPMAYLAPGDLRVLSGSAVVGFAWIGGDLVLEPGAEFIGEARVAGQVLLGSGAGLTPCAGLAREALDRFRAVAPTGAVSGVPLSFPL